MTYTPLAPRVPRHSDVPPEIRLIGLWVVVGVGYFFLARLGLSFLSDRLGVAAVWPANGITLAALLMVPQHRWAGVLASGYVGNVLANITADRPVTASFLYSGVNALEVLFAALCMRFAFRQTMRLETTREVVLFTCVACAGGGAFGGFLGALCVQSQTVDPGSFLSVWRFWAVVDALGMLTITPPILAVAYHRPFFRSPLSLLEKVACLSLFTAAVAVLFRGGTSHQMLLLTMPYVTLLPFLLWAGMRLDVRVSSLLTVILVTVGAWSTVHGHGPFAAGEAHDGNGIIAFQMSAILWGLSALALSTVTTERRAATAALLKSEAKAREAEGHARQAEQRSRAARAAAEASAGRAKASAEQAESASRAKTDFLANISHEIRTPLTAILGYSDLLFSPSLSAEQRVRNAQTIRRNGEHLLSILNDVLDMSKIEAGRMTIERVGTGLPEIMAEVMSLMRHRATEKGLTLVAECRTPVPVRIVSDPTRLRQIVMNLIGNAVKFTNRGTVRVALAMEPVSVGEELVIEVIDTGIGMSKEHLQTLGEPFTQADPSHTRQFGGSGLGLSICYRLAELMGGSISCRSEEGVGSTFTLRLPVGDLTGIARVTQLRDGTDAPVQLEAPSDVASLAGRVLIAEDSIDTQRLLLAYLRRTRVEAQAVDNGQAAVDAAVAAWRSGKPFDLILMDVQMPQMDGVAATNLLRSQGYPGRIVALTANAMEPDRLRCIAAGCDGFLTKPIRGDAFLNSVRFYLDGSERPRGADAVPSVGGPGSAER